MGKIIATTSITLDGVVQDPDGGLAYLTYELVRAA
jgi:hypothetical protein